MMTGNEGRSRDALLTLYVSSFTLLRKTNVLKLACWKISSKAASFWEPKHTVAQSTVVHVWVNYILPQSNVVKDLGGNGYDGIDTVKDSTY